MEGGGGGKETFQRQYFFLFWGREKRKVGSGFFGKERKTTDSSAFLSRGQKNLFFPVLFARSRKREKVKVMLILFIKHLTVITPLSFSSPLLYVLFPSRAKPSLVRPSPLRPTPARGGGAEKKKGEGILKNRKGRGRGRENRRRKETRK